MSYVNGYTSDPSTLFRFAFNSDLVKDVIVENRDGEFDSYQIGSVDNINTGDVVTMFQTSKNSSTADLVVYVKRSDAEYATGAHSDFTFKTANGHNITTSGSPQSQCSTAVFGNTGKTTSGAIDIGNGLKIDGTVAATAGQDNHYTVTVSFTGTATKKVDKLNVTLKGNDVTIATGTVTTANASTNTQAVDAAGTPTGSITFAVVSTKGSPVLDRSGENVDVHYAIQQALKQMAL